MKLSRPVGVFVVFVLVVFEVVLVVWGYVRMQLPMRGWFNAMKKEPLINKANLTLLKFV